MVLNSNSSLTPPRELASRSSGSLEASPRKNREEGETFRREARPKQETPPPSQSVRPKPARGPVSEDKNAELQWLFLLS